MKPRISALIVLFIISSFAYISATTRIVDINGNGQYTSIQSAISACASGDTVLVYPGRYLENLIIQTSNISLISLEYITNNPAYIDSTIIDGNQVNACLKIYQNYENILVRGFSISNGGLSGGGGIVLAPYSVSNFVNCKVFDNIANNGSGISINMCTVFLSGVKVFNNHGTGMGGGIYIYGYMGTVNVTFDSVNRCSIYNNTAGAGQDIYAHSLNNNLNLYLDTFTVLNPTSYYACKHIASGNDFQLIFDINNADHQEINQDLYVSTNGDDSNDGLTPQTALKTIHTAIYRIAADSLAQKTVHILPGTYSRTANQQIFPIALKSWVNVVGSGMENTLIIGSPNPEYSNQIDIVFDTNYESDILLGWISITSINSTNISAISGKTSANISLMDMHIYGLNPRDVAVIRCNFTGDCLWDNITIENITTPRFGLISCSFRGNIRNCTFRNANSTFVSDDVWAYSLIMLAIEDYVNFENCSFDNFVMADDDSRAIQIGGITDQNQINHFNLINCRFTDFTCQSDIIVIASTNNPMVNVTNCTFAGSSGNASMFYINGTANITNSIFYNDTLVEIRLYNQTGEQNNLTVDYSCLRRGQTGISSTIGSIVNYLPTNLNADPLFLGESYGYLYKYYLSDTSPCINTGTPDTTGLFLPEFDLLDNPRIYNNRIDLGAYEWNGTGIEDEYAPEATIRDVRVYPNPFHLKANIAFYLPKDTIAKISIYNTKGQLVRELGNDSYKQGYNKVIWDGKDKSGNKLATGIYCCKIQGKTYTITKKITLFR